MGYCSLLSYKDHFSTNNWVFFFPGSFFFFNVQFQIHTIFLTPNTDVYQWRILQTQDKIDISMTETRVIFSYAELCPQTEHWQFLTFHQKSKKEFTVNILTQFQSLQVYGHHVLHQRSRQSKRTTPRLPALSICRCGLGITPTAREELHQHASATGRPPVWQRPRSFTTLGCHQDTSH